VEKANISDRITEGYYDKMGDQVGKKVRERVHWICLQASGGKILDVGCSQGIVPIILGREGYNVTGIDVDQGSIDFAQEQLTEERVEVQEYVKFVCDNFMTMDHNGQKYDTIIATELLEHLVSPERFLLKFNDLLNEDGRLIVTVPFGINDYFDHKKTYYLLEIVKLLAVDFAIDDIKFFGKWMGVICTKQTSEVTSIDYEQLMKSIEENFFSIEREYIDTISEKTKHISNQNIRMENFLKTIESGKEKSQRLLDELKSLQLKYEKNEIEYDKKEVDTRFRINRLAEDKKKISEDYQYLKSDYENRVDILKEEYNNTLALKEEYYKKELELQKQESEEQLKLMEVELQKERNESVEKEKALITENENLKQENREIRKSFTHKLKEYYDIIEDYYERYHRVTQQRKTLIERTHVLSKRNNLLNDKYKALSCSKLGRIALKYWKLRKRFKNGQ